jgi:gamma-glutamyl hydrolase
MHSKLQEEDDSFELHEVYPNVQFIELSHVKFLEAAGARVIPIDYTRDIHELKYLLESINGLYIPGDSKSLVQGENGDYINSIRRILKWAQEHNEKEAQHFPVLGVGYGFLSLMKSQLNDGWTFEDFNAGGKQQLNLAHEPSHTYLYD